MSTTTLKKITAEAKRIRKLHPSKHRKWSGYVKEAGKKYREGKIGAARRKKSAPKKRAKRRVSSPRPKAVGKKRKSARRSAPKVKVVKVVRYRERSTVGSRRRKRVSGTDSLRKILPWAVVIVGGILLWKYMGDKDKEQQQQQPTTTLPQVAVTTNPVRNTQAQDLVNYAVAGGLAIDAIIKLVNSLNKKSDSEVSSIYNSVAQTNEFPGYLFT